MSAKIRKTGILQAALYFLILIVSSSGCGNLPQGRYGQEAVKIAVLPAYSTSVMSAKYLPLLNKLSRETGLDVQYISAENIASFGASVENSEAQLALCDALTFLTLRKTKNAVALVIGQDQSGVTETCGLVITSFSEYSKGIDDISKLKGRSVCCASKLLSEGYISQARALLEKGIDPGHDLRIITLGQMDGVLSGLKQGAFAAGFIPQSLWNDSLSKCYKVLSAGAPVPNWVLVSLQGGHTEMDEKVKSAALALDPAKSEDQKILTGLGIYRFVTADGMDLQSFADMADQLNAPY